MFVDILRTFASSLQTPVIVALIALVAIMVVIVGMLIAEVFTERMMFRVSLPRLIDGLNHEEDTKAVIERSELLRRQKDALLELLAHPDIDETSRESLAVNLVSEEQAHFDVRVKVTDTIAKIAPMLGLMGTLIPLGPGLIAIGEGNTEILSESLLIAFDTTILGLIVAAVALVVSVIRKTWYAKYMAAFESAAECTLQVANEQAAAEQAAARRGASRRSGGSSRERSGDGSNYRGAGYRRRNGRDRQDARETRSSRDGAEVGRGSDQPASSTQSGEGERHD